MNNFQVLQKPIDYEGCPVYIRRMNEMFEYITVIRGEVYTAHIVARKTIGQRLLFKDYTKKQLSDLTQYMLAMATTTIDTVLGINREPEKK